MWINKNGKNFRVQMSPLDEEEYNKRMRIGMRVADMKAKEEQDRIASLATCPDCNLKCTQSGFCMRCGKDCRSQLKKSNSVKVRIVKYKY